MPARVDNILRHVRLESWCAAEEKKLVYFNGIGLNRAFMSLQEPNRGLERVKFQLRISGLDAESCNRLRSGIHTRGYLPHVKREGVSYFVTFRLADSLPREVLLRFETERAAALRERGGKATKERWEETNRELRRKVERYLDQGAGACHLNRDEVRGVVAEALQYGHGRQYFSMSGWSCRITSIL